MKISRPTAVACTIAGILGVFLSCTEKAQDRKESLNLPTSKKLLLPAPGDPQKTNSFPTAAALSPDGRYLAILNNGYGTEESGYQQSIAILNLATNKLADFPDPRLGQNAHQTYFLGLAFSADGAKLYASMSSLTDPTGSNQGDTGNGVAVYRFEHGRIKPESFLKIPLAPLGKGKQLTGTSPVLPHGKSNPYPAGIAVISSSGAEKLLVAENLSDDAILLDAAGGKIIHRFALSKMPVVPGAYPYGVVATRDGKRGYCSLWNGSEVVELNLEKGRVTRRIVLDRPSSSVAAGSHPTAMLLGRDEKKLYVALTNNDQVAVVDTATGKTLGFLSTLLPGQKYGGCVPMALALSKDGSRLFVANASTNAVAIFDTSKVSASAESKNPPTTSALGFIPTEWYPTALAVSGGDLFVVTGKGKGTGPNSMATSKSTGGNRGWHPYIATLIHGSVARISIDEAENRLAELTREVEDSNLMNQTGGQIHFQGGTNPIRHVIYIIKENRTYDQILGDLTPGNGDPSLTMFGEDITPNQHQLARQFGILDNFYCSGEVSGDGHVWSTAAITSDYNEKTWQIAYRSNERSYDFGGQVMSGVPLYQHVPDVDEPGTGFIWANVAQNGLTQRDYGEYVLTRWCDNQAAGSASTKEAPLPADPTCKVPVVRKGELLPRNVGQPHGSPSPWPWPVPMIQRNYPSKPQLEGHSDPFFGDFRLDYPDQLRADEFLNEFAEFVNARKTGQGTELPQFIILYLPSDHTAGTGAGMPTPAAMVADNDLAVGRVVDAVSHSPYWEDTAILILEDDAQDGPDHVDAHRSPALVISKYSPGSSDHPTVEHGFYTTVNMIHTMEVLLGLPPMNNNDARAPVMAPMFSGNGEQKPFKADWRNLKNGLIYEMNPPDAPGSKQSARMDFSRPDAINAALLNLILWKDRKGNVPMPKPRHSVIRKHDD